MLSIPAPLAKVTRGMTCTASVCAAAGRRAPGAARAASRARAPRAARRVVFGMVSSSPRGRRGPARGEAGTPLPGTEAGLLDADVRAADDGDVALRILAQ